MKSLSLTIIIVAVLGLLAYTNPKPDQFERYVHQEITQEVNKQSDDLQRTLGHVFGGIASSMVTSQAVRNDYVFLSIYDIGLGKEHLKALGILNNFFLLEAPTSLKERNK